LVEEDLGARKPAAWSALRLPLWTRMKAASRPSCAAANRGDAALGVFSMTARRDLGKLQRRGILRRTHGGAASRRLRARGLLREPARGRRGGQARAETAAALLRTGETVFLDFWTTSYLVAHRIVETGHRDEGPHQNVFAEGGADSELVGIGGALRRLTRSFVRPSRCARVCGHFADRLFLSVK
jgi:DeoR/GlpR family transcriptional regulator of sugar metabolism